MFLEIFSIWLTLLTIGFTAMPTLMVLDWKKRGTAEGFSSVTLVLPMMVQTFWLRYAWMTNNQIFVIINKNLVYQILVVVTAIKLVFAYVESFAPESINEVMGTMAAGAQIFNLFGAVYEIISNLAALLVNITTLVLYFFYPPLTWTVPIFNIPAQKKAEGEETKKIE